MTSAQDDRSSGRHQIWVLLDRIQMDIGATAAKMVELRAHVASLNLEDVRTHGQWQPALGVKDPAAAIRRQIENRSLTTRIDLDAELAATPVTEAERAVLIALLEERKAA